MPSPDAAALIAALRPGADALRPCRTMVVVAHPDDETIGIGGLLAHLPEALLLHVTDGAPRDAADARAHGFPGWRDYAAARRAELARGTALAGVAAHAHISLRLPDQGAAYRLTALAHRIAAMFARRAPDLVFTHPYEGGHPDHDATCFAVHAACALLREARRPAPAVAEMAFYHAGPDGVVYQAFPAPGPPEVVVRLSDADWARKQAMLACHATQTRTLAPFTSRTERFRPAPDYEFRQPPNGGRFHYDSFNWGLTGQDWRTLSEAALDRLTREPALCP